MGQGAKGVEQRAWGMGRGAKGMGHDIIIRISLFPDVLIIVL
jgi:hypothetical protein